MAGVFLGPKRSQDGDVSQLKISLANSYAQEKRAGGTPLGSWETNHLLWAVM